MRVALAYNVKKNKPSKNLKQQSDLEFDSPAVINGILKTLENLGHTTYKVEADENAFIKLKKLRDLPANKRLDIVFNIAEGLWGDARESQVPLFCEVLKIPYTHSSPSTHAMTLDKQFTKWILEGAKVVKTPKSQTVLDKNYKFDRNLNFPVIVKPNKEGSGKGIVNENIVSNIKDLEKRVKVVSEDFQKEVIIEEFINGREFTVGVLGNGNNLKVLPIIEQQFGLLPEGMHKVAGFELKWIYEYNMTKMEDVYICPAKIDEKLKTEIEKTSKEICKVLDVRDAARIDYRLNSKGKLYFLEINTLPGIYPDPAETSCFPLAARVAGLSYDQMIERILESACKRYNIKAK